MQYIRDEPWGPKVVKELGSWEVGQRLENKESHCKHACSCSYMHSEKEATTVQKCKITFHIFTRELFPQFSLKTFRFATFFLAGKFYHLFGAIAQLCSFCRGKDLPSFLKTIVSRFDLVQNLIKKIGENIWLYTEICFFFFIFYKEPAQISLWLPNCISPGAEQKPLPSSCCIT